ncbi:class I SAM-dependent methyltransferase [Pseudonocardia eucalypti]|uniref:Class I SAM-dependent methyltransferase n=1 Tax=Pseudonocardia eucalypti TaxID=648755 RepID=A0ABP9QEW1_9PSEU|nr:ubiquinone/menaquinone biosynthesis C-methylase UbiE [Pseudonocardia eucalypti]
MTTELDFLTATRDSYDAVAGDYVAFAADELGQMPLERGMLAAFAELVGEAGPVADIGCGTGRVTGHLRSLGLDVFGVDLSPGMLAEARRAHPEARFQEGSMLALDIPDGSLAGLLAWYSTIHLPDEELPKAFAEFARVLAPGGWALLAFQIGDEPLRLTEALGHAVVLDFHRRRPEAVAKLLGAAGLPVHGRLVREPKLVRLGGEERMERTPSAYLLATRSDGSEER